MLTKFSVQKCGAPRELHNRKGTTIETKKKKQLPESPCALCLNPCSRTSIFLNLFSKFWCLKLAFSKRAKYHVSFYMYTILRHRNSIFRAFVVTFCSHFMIFHWIIGALHLPINGIEQTFGQSIPWYTFASQNIGCTCGEEMSVRLENGLMQRTLFPSRKSQRTCRIDILGSWFPVGRVVCRLCCACKWQNCRNPCSTSHLRDTSLYGESELDQRRNSVSNLCRSQLILP